MNIPGKLVTNIELAPEAGAFQFYSEKAYGSRAGIWYRCPCGCGDLRTVSIENKQTGRTGWKWDDQDEAPTLTPSIRHIDRCKWHGHLTKGVWVGA